MTNNNEEKPDRPDLVPIGGLWIHEDRDGKTFLSGYLGEALLFVFRNKFKKKGEKQPDYRMYVTPKPIPDNSDPLTDSEADPLQADAGATPPESAAGNNEE